MAAQERRELSSPLTEENGASLQLSDCLCPICMSILIEPVTMPCSHELCMPCFRQNVEEANFTCPLCRIRISSWARKQSRENRLINQNRWKIIQNAFPEKCRRRLEGLEDESFEEEILAHHIPLISQPGEVRKEFEEQLNRMKQQKIQEEEKEMQASAELIKKLQEEETKQIEERRRRHELQRLEDEELARKLSSNIAERDVLMEEPEPIPVSLSDEDLAKQLNDEINHIPNGDEELARKLQQEINQILVPNKSPDVISNTSKKLSGSGSSKKGSRSSSTSKDSVISIETFFAKAANKSTTPSRESSESCILVECTSEPLPSRSSSENTESISVDMCDGSQTKTPDKKKESQSGLPDRTAPSGGRSSSASTDSISMELNHFKPIHSSPRTPPKRHIDGTLKSPTVIHSTPRNLQSKFDNQKDETEWLQRSPLVMAKWLSLVEERKRKVENQSKGTMTGSEQISPHPIWANGKLDEQNKTVIKAEITKNTELTKNSTVRFSSNKRKVSATVTSEQQTQTNDQSPRLKHERLLDFKLSEDCERKSFRRKLLKIPASYQVEDSDEEMPPVLQMENSKNEQCVKSKKEIPMLNYEGDERTEKAIDHIETKKQNIMMNKGEHIAVRRRGRLKSGNANNNNSGSDDKAASGTRSQPTKETRSTKVRTIDSMFAQKRDDHEKNNDDNSHASSTSTDKAHRKSIRNCKGSDDKMKPTSPRTPRKNQRYRDDEDSPKKAGRLKNKERAKVEQMKDSTPQKNDNDDLVCKDIYTSPRRKRQVYDKVQNKVVKSLEKGLNDSASDNVTQDATDSRRTLDVETDVGSEDITNVSTSVTNIINRGEGDKNILPEKPPIHGEKSSKFCDKVTRANPQPLHNSTNITRHKRNASGSKGNKNKKLKLDSQPVQRTIDQFTSPTKKTISQEEIDFQFALKLQKEFDSETQKDRNQVNRAKGSKDAYMLRQASTKSDSSVWVT